MLALGLALVALVASTAADKCDEHKRTETWFRLMQSKRFDDVERMYHRNALRFENGVLAAATSGQPQSARQLACVDSRVEQRYEATGYAQDARHHTTVVVGLRHVGVERPWQFAVHFIWDTKTCLISEEHWTFSTAHAAAMRVADRVDDDCFGADLAFGAAATALQRFKDCWNFLVRKEPVEMANCFASEGEFLHNGVPFYPDLSDADIWRTHLAAVDYRDLEFHLTHDDELNSVSGIVQGRLVLNDDDDDNDDDPDESWTFSTAARAVLSSNGKFGVYEAIGSEAVLLRSPSYAAWLPPTTDSNWQSDAAKMALTEAENLFGAALHYHNVNTNDGWATFGNPDNIGCFDGFIVFDRAADHFPGDENAAENAAYHIHGFVTVDVPADKIFVIQKIGSAVAYVPGAKTLYVAGDSVGTVVAQTVLALDVATNRKSLADAKEDLGKNIDKVHKRSGGERETRDDGTYKYDDKFDEFASKICNRVRQLNDTDDK